MIRRARWLLAFGLAGVGAAGCGSDKPPQVLLQASAAWNTSPSSVDQTGYQVSADVGWPDRATSCFALSPNLNIRINDGETMPMVYGDCRFDVLVTSGAFQQDVPITIKLEDGDQVLAQAEFDDLFPGANAHLVTPASGQQVAIADPIVISLPVAPSAAAATYAEFFWLDTPSNVPPFNTFASGTVSADGSTFQTAAPAITGHAAVVVRTIFDDDFDTASSCTGFESCSGLVDNQTMGPVFLEVVN